MTLAGLDGGFAWAGARPAGCGCSCGCGCVGVGCCRSQSVCRPGSGSRSGSRSCSHVQHTAAKKCACATAMPFTHTHRLPLPLPCSHAASQPARPSAIAPASHGSGCATGVVALCALGSVVFVVGASFVEAEAEAEASITHAAIFSRGIRACLHLPS